MSTYNNTPQPKTFWQKPEGKVGTVFLLGILGGLGYILYAFGATLLGIVSTTIGLVASLAVLGVILFLAFDPKVRALVSYMYKSVMRWITGLFITIDPIGILKNYISDLEKNLAKMSKQIGNIRGQMRKLKTIVETNNSKVARSQKAELLKPGGACIVFAIQSGMCARTRDT